ncbi:hypothetical protein K501DRAFT_276564 [Backusella circina FSU 941]|nr:hypothetical protein K501DRAFT_276564 [Backusella circina FSU 941]
MTERIEDDRLTKKRRFFRELPLQKGELQLLTSSTINSIFTKYFPLDKFNSENMKDYECALKNPTPYLMFRSTVLLKVEFNFNISRIKRPFTCSLQKNTLHPSPVPIHLIMSLDLKILSVRIKPSPINKNVGRKY